jgi:hypothetical protein
MESQLAAGCSSNDAAAIHHHSMMLVLLEHAAVGLLIHMQRQTTQLSTNIKTSIKS